MEPISRNPEAREGSDHHSDVIGAYLNPTVSSDSEIPLLDADWASKDEYARWTRGERPGSLSGLP